MRTAFMLCPIISKVKNPTAVWSPEGAGGRVFLTAGASWQYLVDWC